MKLKRQPSLFGRVLLAFLAVMLIIWLATLARTVYETTVTQRRIAAIENRGWTQQILLNMRSVDDHPEQMPRIGQQIEVLRQDMFKDMGFDPPPVHVQVWKGAQLVFGAAPGLSSDLPQPDAASPLGDDWVSSMERGGDLTVRRLAKVNGGWIFSTSGAAYYLTPLLYSFPFLLLPAWFLVKAGLRPLRAMVGDIEARGAADLRPLAATPYVELSPLAEAINGLMQRLKLRQQSEKAFLADAAHELKTPLSVIQMNAHLLLSRLPADDEGGRLQEAGRGLQQGVARAAHAVHQLLALERAGSDGGSPLVEDVDLLRFLRERLAAAAPAGWERGVELELQGEGSCVLPLHRESLEALFDNLFDNAIKYSPPQGRVLVALHGSGRDCRCTVQDEGPGIAPALREKVFERFYRVPGQSQGGSGLGLAIARQAAARNGASVVIEDGAGDTGATLVVRFGGALTTPC